MGRIGLIGVALLALVSVTVTSDAAAAPRQELPAPDDVAVAALRQVCDRQWVEGICELTGYDDPQYRTGQDPSPGQPLALRIGAVHEHSGYSDGDPTTRPEDYFTAARTGHNVADAGGDTGVIVDFLFSSEHSDNEKLPITTAEVCVDPDGVPEAIEQLDLTGLPPLLCSKVDQPDHYRKWDETLAQAIEATDVTPGVGYDGFTAMRGFEWTNDYFNHLNVYFSRNVVNAKIDGSYLSMETMWNWLRRPSTEGGGDDALVVFNHPGGLPALSPFDGDLPHNQVLADTLGGENWNDLAYVPDVDDRVAGIEVNGGDDLEWYLRGLANGWHIGPLAAEDEHQREWASTNDGKTLVLTRGRGPRDYYFALRHHRTVAVADDLVGGAPGTPATFPRILFWTGAADVQDPAATVLGGVVEQPGTHSLEVDIDGLPDGYEAVVVSSTLDDPRPLGTAGADGAIRTSIEAATPAAGEDWWVVVVCAAGVSDCGTGEEHSAVTAPIWLRAADAAGPSETGAPMTGDVGGPVAAPVGARLPETGADPWPFWFVGLVAALAGVRIVGTRSERSDRP